MIISLGTHFKDKYMDTKNNLNNIYYNNVQSIFFFKVSFKRDIHKKTDLGQKTQPIGLKHPEERNASKMHRTLFVENLM